MAGFIEQAKPLRWKIFKVLNIENQNQDTYENFEISDDEFSLYLKRNTTPGLEKIMVAEDNNAMSESYLMVDPAGRFFDNSTGTYRYSQSIWEVGVENALQRVNFDYEKYLRRGAVYEWQG